MNKLVIKEIKEWERKHGNLVIKINGKWYSKESLINSKEISQQKAKKLYNKIWGIKE